jgi:two-component system NtrC family sensor kinase
LRTDETITPELRQELLERMDREVERIRATLRHLLDFGRPAPDKPQSIQIANIIQSTLEIVCYHGQMKHVSVEVSGTVKMAWIDPSKLGQVMTNLFLNAAAAMDGQGQIHIQLSETQSCALVLIWDDGPGIPEGESSSIFEPFFSTKPQGVGTGLGLFVSQRVMEDAGGSLRLLRTAPESALFELRIPFASPDAEHLLG